jgi:hypothetical protein
LSPNDVFDDASDLSIQLLADGAEDRAEAVSDAVRHGSTGTEILNNLGHELSLLLEDKETPISEKTRATAERLLKQVKQLLRG